MIFRKVTRSFALASLRKQLLRPCQTLAFAPQTLPNLQQEANKQLVQRSHGPQARGITTHILHFSKITTHELGVSPHYLRSWGNYPRSSVMDETSNRSLRVLYKQETIFLERYDSLFLQPWLTWASESLPGVHIPGVLQVLECHQTRITSKLVKNIWVAQN